MSVAAVERGPISKWKTDRPGMGHKLPRLKSGVSAEAFGAVAGVPQQDASFENVGPAPAGETRTGRLSLSRAGDVRGAHWSPD